jgi:hypothetical protein
VLFIPHGDAHMVERAPVSPPLVSPPSWVA